MANRLQHLHATALLQLRVELKSIEPLIWRHLVVPDTITLIRLHDVIQAAMGWTDTHLHEFEIGHQRYGEPDPEWDIDDSVIPEKRVRLLKALAGRQSFTYLYDFGDGWEHKVTIKKTLPSAEPKRYPICIGGENACPPEDVGGPYGYTEYLTAIGDKNHPEHDDMMAWGREDFDPRAFDLEETNTILKRIRC